MGKVTEWVKEVKLITSIIKTIVAVMTTIATFTPIAYSFTKNIIKTETAIIKDDIAPLKKYIYGDIEKLIVKNASKIQKDPEDVKIEDVETALNWWPMLKESNIINKQTLEQQIRVLEDWYRQNKV